MRLLVSVESWGAGILAALALTSGCDGTTTTSSSSGGGAPPGETSSFACEDPAPVLVGGVDTGYVRCADGWLHRAKVVTCPSPLPRAEACVPPEGGQAECSTDADCTARANGYCGSFNSGDALPGCYCNYGCTTDAECDSGQICLCGDPIGQCAAATCTEDAACGKQHCSTYVSNPGCGGTAFACQTPVDECASDADCPMGEQCTLAALRRVCQQPTCAIGRPFLVEGLERVAPDAMRDDWRAAGEVAAPAVERLSGAQRAALAAHWTRAGLMEHASIAAFARFALQLLSMGAPPELIGATQAAMADETEHARACFALASAYAGRGVGPGPLGIEGALGRGEAREVLVTAIREGCIGETVAAIEAAEAALHATDPVVQRALRKIAEDETRHAELAWRFVAWAIERDPSLRDAAAAELCGAPAAAPVADGDADASLLGSGVLDAPRRREIRRRALEQVVGPCARALLRRPACAALPQSLRSVVPSGVTQA